MSSAKDRLIRDFDVSRETLEKLEIYASLVERWTRKINLISAKSVPEIWHRHILDSAQLFPLLPIGFGTLADFGSGAGFPGMVLALMRSGESHQPAFHFVESDQRKATFLRTVARETGTEVAVHATRIETLSPLSADVIMARALAPLSTLLPFVKRHGHAGTKAMFLKGQTASDEIEAAKTNWSFTCRQHPSITDPDAQIIELGDIRERRDAS